MRTTTYVLALGFLLETSLTYAQESCLVLREVEEGNCQMGSQVATNGSFAVIQHGGYTGQVYERCDDGWAWRWTCPSSIESERSAIGTDYVAFTESSGDEILIYELDGDYVTSVPYAPGQESIVQLAFADNDLVVSKFDNGIPQSELEIWSSDNSWASPLVDFDGTDDFYGGPLVASSTKVLFNLGVAGDIVELVKAGTWGSPSSTTLPVAGYLVDINTSGDAAVLYSVNGGGYGVLTLFTLSGTWSSALAVTTSNTSIRPGCVDGDLFVLTDGDDVRVFRYMSSAWNNEMDPLVDVGTTIMAMEHDQLLLGGYDGIFCYEDIDPIVTHLLIFADGNKATSWEVRDEANNLIDSGSGYANGCPGSAYDEVITLSPCHTYNLRITQNTTSFCSGGFVWQIDASHRIWDMTSSNNGGLTMSSTTLNYYDAFGYTSTDFDNWFNPVIGAPVRLGGDDENIASRGTYQQNTGSCEVDYICNLGSTSCSDLTTTGFQWQWSRPNGGFTRRLTINLSIPQDHVNFDNPGGTDACAMIEYVSAGPLNQTQPQINTVYNFRTRARINGEFRPWGPVVRIRYTGSPMQPPRMGLFPNPTAGTTGTRFQLFALDEESNTEGNGSESTVRSVQIFDAVGRAVGSAIHTEASNTTSFTLPMTLLAGTYFVQLTTPSSSTTVPLLIE